ncbi:anthranilate synthase component II [Neptunicella sp. SCSIO 80796]|uniref:anthranilate synthase component II n=1 Tax=Neptunicella plasticusilytica TaxID=3117012 RepID=UPI003A4E3776
MLLLIDNYDSFTHNLARYFCELGQAVEVYRNDEISLQQIEELAPEYLVISPGPCTPDEAGISLAAIRHFAERIPILGVCLGYQAIGQVFGAKVVRAGQVLHGKVSNVFHQQTGLFEDVTNPFIATRYHSLILQPDSIPAEFTVTARSVLDNGETEAIMAIEHKTLPLCGVQFHPESVMTTSGHQILSNFLKLKKIAEKEANLS